MLLILFYGALVSQLGKLWVLGHNVHVACLGVRNHTVGAILDGASIRLLDIGEITTALICQGVQWAVTKQTVEIFLIVGFVTRKVLAVAILKK